MTKSVESNDLYADYFDKIVESGPPILKKYITYISSVGGDSLLTLSNYYRDLILFFRFVLDHRGINVDYSGLSDNESAQAHEYDNLISIVTPYVDDIFVRSITKDEVLDFLHYLKNKKNNKASSRNRRLTSLKGFFDYLEFDVEMITNNPTRKIKLAKEENKLPKYLTLEEAQTLLKSVPHDENYARNYCILVFFLNMGLRLSELVGINIPDINGNKLRVYGKGSKERIVDLDPACVQALSDYMKVRYSDVYFVKKEFRNALFVSKQGRRISGNRVYHMVADCLEYAGLSNRGFSPHKLRHTAATLMLQNGAGISSIQKVLGHRDLSTTKIYAHVSDSMVHEAIMKNPLSNFSANKPIGSSGESPENTGSD